jgi:hypothetical protein
MSAPLPDPIDAAAIEVVRRELDPDAVAEQHPDAVPISPRSQVVRSAKAQPVIADATTGSCRRR